MKPAIIRNGDIVTPGGVFTGDLFIADGKIASLRRAGYSSDPATVHDEPSVEIDCRGALVVPGFIDVHIHGAFGANPMNGEAGLLQVMARKLATWGVTSFCVTTMAAPFEELLRVTDMVAANAGRSRQRGWDGASMLGVHFEGPYLNARRCGAQPLAHLRPPDMGEIRELFASANGLMVIFSLAPELPGALKAIEWLAGEGVVVSAAHSDATWEEMKTAVDAGLTHATHTFNGMRAIHHREPGLVGEILMDKRVWAEVIADGQHVHPDMVRLLWQAKGHGQVGVVTDLTHLAGLAAGTYVFAGQEVTLTGEQATLVESGGLAGSVTPMCRVFHNLLSWGFDPVDAVAMTSLNPARQVGIGDRKGSIGIGKDADIVIITRRGGVIGTFVAGELVYGEGC